MIIIENANGQKDRLTEAHWQAVVEEIAVLGKCAVVGWVAETRLRRVDAGPCQQARALHPWEHACPLAEVLKDRLASEPAIEGAWRDFFVRLIAFLRGECDFISDELELTVEEHEEMDAAATEPTPRDPRTERLQRPAAERFGYRILLFVPCDYCGAAGDLDAKPRGPGLIEEMVIECPECDGLGVKERYRPLEEALEALGVSLGVQPPPLPPGVTHPDLAQLEAEAAGEDPFPDEELVIANDLVRIAG